MLSDVEQLCASVVLLSKGKLKSFSRIDEASRARSEAYEVTARGVPEGHAPNWGKQIRHSPIGETWRVDGTDDLLAASMNLKIWALKSLACSVNAPHWNKSYLENRQHRKRRCQNRRPRYDRLARCLDHDA
ncbi:MAG: hypothetical protein R3B54_14070 [Bdellovibrionota bacterium]